MSDIIEAFERLYHTSVCGVWYGAVRCDLTSYNRAEEDPSYVMYTITLLRIVLYKVQRG